MKDEVLALIRQFSDDNNLGVLGDVAMNLADQEKYEECLTYLLGGMDVAYLLDSRLGPALHALRNHIKNLVRARP